MKKEYYGHSKSGGVYRITNIKNGKIYIGSCKCFQVRANQHASSLRNQKHQNKHLQASWNKWGEDSFLFEVLEVVEGDKLLRTTLEEKLLQEQIILGNWDKCFNFQRKPKSNERSCFSKNPEKTRKKLSKAIKAAISNPEERNRRSITAKKMWKNSEYRRMMSKKISNAKKGKKRSEAFRKKMSENMKKRWANPSIAQKYLDSFNSELFKNKMSAIAKEGGYQPDFSGRKHTNETKKKIGQKSKEMWENKKNQEHS